MKILVFEYVTGGGMAGEPLPEALAREGGLMANALLRDLSGIAGVQVIALRDSRLSLPNGRWGDSVEWVSIEPADDWMQRLSGLLSCCDAVWPVAPETDGILEKLCLVLETAGAAHLNSRAAAVRVAASKRLTAECLDGAGVPVVETVVREQTPPMPWPVVVKPDDGAGCEGSRIVVNEVEWAALPAIDEWPNTVVQPLLSGEPMSISALFSRGAARVLSVNRQSIEHDSGTFVLRGCAVNIAPAEIEPLVRVAESVAQAMPELWGYAGIDLMLSGADVIVLEVNPRLTTSYAGLREATGINPAGLVLDLWRRGELPSYCPGGKAVELRWGAAHD